MNWKPLKDFLFPEVPPIVLGYVPQHEQPVKIIKPGVLPSHRFTGKCKTCNAEIECGFSTVSDQGPDRVSSPAYPNRYHVPCPTKGCRATVWVYPIPFRDDPCSEYRGSGKCETRYGTYSDFCVRCGKPRYFHAGELSDHRAPKPFTVGA